MSEIMLQQTQVERVIPFYKKFIKKFPTAGRLASASLASVLRMWQGLGYNRRAKMLRAAAVGMRGKKQLSVAQLQALPGVGPYTARAVAAFAYNDNVVFIETNIRTAVIHRFLPKRHAIPDAEIEKILTRVLPKGRARQWYGALMDYGSYLKRSGVSHNARSRSYVKQPKFPGSPREARGAVLRALARNAASASELRALLGPARRAQVTRALHALRAEALIEERSGEYALATGNP